MPELADEVPYELGKARVEREGADVTIVFSFHWNEACPRCRRRTGKKGIQRGSHRPDLPAALGS